MSKKEATPSEELFPTSDQQERTLAPVTVRARYVWAERNKALLDSELPVDEEDIPVGGVRRGLGDPSSENNYAPEKVFGYAIRHPGIRKQAENGATYGIRKTYLSPFYRSVLAGITTSERVWDGGNSDYQVERVPSPAKMSKYLNEEVFRKRVVFPADFQYEDADGDIMKDAAIRTYKMAAKIVLLDLLNSRHGSNWQSRCVVCWEPRYSYCDDCEVRVTSLAHDTPPESLFSLIKSAHKMLPTEVSDSIAGNIRIMLRDFLDDEASIWAIAPSFETIYGQDATYAEEIKGMVGEPPLEPPYSHDALLEVFQGMQSSQGDEGDTLK